MRSFLILLFAFILKGLVLGQEDPVLMVIEDTPIYLSEFTYIYEKNNGEEADYSKESIEEYLDLFINFKLKVEKAKKLKLDTIQALISELAGYRKQLAKSYLMDREITQRIIDEMWNRRQWDVQVSHILYKLRKNPTQQELSYAFDKAIATKKSIQDGKDWKVAVEEESQDNNSKSSGGNLGYLTAWLPMGFYELENAAYSLSLNEISDPIITRLGVHLIKVEDRRDAFGKIEVAHILARDENGNSKEKIDLVYNKIQEGEDFFELAKTYSDDKTSSHNGGMLKPFGINTFERAFEEAAFALEEDGQISEPVRTRFGWHIIKRIKIPVESYEEFNQRMKPQVSKLDRFNAMENKLVEEIKEETGFKYDEELLLGFSESVDSSFLTYRWQIPELDKNIILMSFGNNYQYSIHDFASYAKRNTRLRMRMVREFTPSEAVFKIFDAFQKEKALQYEEKNLENKYLDFKNLMREYQEGILLFEVSKMEVWDKASQDSSGLEKYYQENRENYFFNPTADLAVISILPGRNMQAREIYNYAETNTVEDLLKKYNAKADIISVTVVETEKEADEVKDVVWEIGKMSSILQDPANNNISFKKIMDIHPIKYKSLNESRGYVIADYQQYLEKKWVESLKKEYDIDIKMDVLNDIMR